MNLPRDREHLALAMILCGCGARSGLVEASASADATVTCEGAAPSCVRASEDPCAAMVLVSAVCDARSWRCPGGSTRHRREGGPASCVARPAEGGTLQGSLVRVPTSDGRCLWVADSLRSADGRVSRNVAFEAPERAFGQCPGALRRAVDIASELVRVERGDDQDLVQVTGGFWLNGAWLSYRLFRADGGPHFGLTLVGTGIARWSAGGVTVPRTPDARFAAMDLGDASLVWRERAYVYGCPGPPEFLTERCVLARFDVDEVGEVFVGGASPWAPLSESRRAATVFDAGPWISSVVEGAPGTLHAITTVGFGSELRARRATAPEGPWSSVSTLARCALPEDDTESYCAGPTAHAERSDPTRPGELWVSYGVGSLAPDYAARLSAHPERYATRFVRVILPR